MFWMDIRKVWKVRKKFLLVDYLIEILKIFVFFLDKIVIEKKVSIEKSNEHSQELKEQK